MRLLGEREGRGGGRGQLFHPWHHRRRERGDPAARAETGADHHPRFRGCARTGAAEDRRHVQHPFPPAAGADTAENACSASTSGSTPTARCIASLDEASVADAVRHAVACGCEGLVIALMHAWRNPAHEHAARAIAQKIAPGLPVICSSDVWPVIREYERTITAVLNGYVQPRIAHYLTSLQAALQRGRGDRRHARHQIEWRGDERRAGQDRLRPDAAVRHRIGRDRRQLHRPAVRAAQLPRASISAAPAPTSR